MYELLYLYNITTWHIDLSIWEREDVGHAKKTSALFGNLEESKKIDDHTTKALSHGEI